jgi:hypothetical protein
MFNAYIETEPEILYTLVVIAVLSVIGLVNYIGGKRKVLKKVIVLPITFIVAIVQSSLVPPVWTAIIDIWLLTLSLSTIAYDVIIKGIPMMVEKLMSKGVTNGGHKEL